MNEPEEEIRDEEYWELVAAVRRSYADYERGERGRLASETSEELRRELGLSDE